MSEWKRGANLSEIKRETNNTTNKEKGVKRQHAGTNINNNQITRRVSFESQPRNKGNNNYNNNNNNNNYNNRNNNYNNNQITRGVSFESQQHRNRQKQEQEQLQNKPVIIQHNDNTTDTEPQIITSKWKEIIEAKKVEESGLINQKNPKFWNGPYWIGPLYVKNVHKTPNYNFSKHSISEELRHGTYVLPRDEFKYSRNNKDWYSTREETYFTDEMEKITDFELQKDYNEYIQNCQLDYQRSKIASEKYYDETGDLDAFAMEQNRLIEYEIYCEEFDKQNNIDYDETDYGDYLE